MQAIRNISIVTFLLFILSGCSSNNDLKISQVEVHPDSRYKTILQVIDSATQSIDLVIYQFNDLILKDALVKAKNRDIAIRVMLEDLPENNFVKEALEKYDIDVKFGNPKYKITHQKTLIIDCYTNKARALIMTYNFKPKYFQRTRDFGVLINSKKAVGEIEEVFEADWNRKNINPSSSSSLVWSPNNSKKKILNLLNSSKTSICIYDLLLQDDQIENALISAVNRKVDVKLILSPLHRNFVGIERISRNGVDIRVIDFPFVHAKTIVVDDRESFVGSQNLETNSLDEHRELGLISSNRQLINKVKTAFKKDWQDGKRYFNEVSFIFQAEKK